MKDKKPLDWIPIYIDKHIFGSTRLELEPDERSVWQDLLILSGKDNGHIRANEGVPYPLEQLAGLFVVKMELLKRTIKKCCSEEVGKIEMQEDGTMYLPSYPTYKLSARHKRRFEQMSAETDAMSKKAVPIEEKSIDIDRVKTEKRKEENIKKKALKKEKLEAILKEEFDEFWIFYRSMGNKRDDSGDKNEAIKAHKTLRRTVDKKIIAQAANGYADFLKSKRVDDNFEQRKMYASSFLRSKRWQRFLDYKYDPQL